MPAVLRTIKRLDVREETKVVHGIVIESGVPVPKRRNPSPLIDVLQALEPGESFLHVSRIFDQRKIVRQRHPERVFLARRLADKRYRIWRTK